jgi:hypothetical protein
VAKEWLETAQLVTSIVAVCALFFTAFQVYTARVVANQSRRVADLQALQKFFEHANERERALLCESASERIFAFNEFLNFLELYAFAYNRDLFGEASEELVRHKLADSYNVLNEVREWHPQIENVIDTSTTMIEFRRFRECHRPEIERRAEERKRSQAKLAAS